MTVKKKAPVPNLDPNIKGKQYLPEASMVVVQIFSKNQSLNEGKGFKIQVQMTWSSCPFSHLLMPTLVILDGGLIKKFSISSQWP